MGSVCMISIMSSVLFHIFDGAVAKPLVKDQVLFRNGDRVRSMYLVIEGTIELVRHTQTGARLVLMRASAGQVFAEASAYAQAYHCDGIAVCDAVVRVMSVADFHAQLDADQEAAHVWAETLAHGLQSARMSSEIRTLRTVSQRLEAWLGVHGNLPPKGKLQGLAQELGVTREALYRELSKSRR